MKEHKRTLAVLRIVISIILVVSIKVAGQTPFEYGATIQASVSAPSEIDRYSFNAGPGDVISLLVNRTGGESNFHPKIEIYDPSGSLLKRVIADLIRLDTSLAGGTYTLWVMDDDGFNTGSYGLRLQRLQPIAGTSVRYDTTVQSFISPVPDIDAFTFVAAANSVITILVNRTGGEVNFHPKVEIYDDHGSLLKRVVGDLIRLDTLLTGGTYTIWIMDDDGFNTGSYGLRLQQLQPNAGTAIKDTTLQSFITPVPDIDAFTFNAASARLTTIVVVRSGGESNFQPKVEIYKPDGSLLKRVVGNSIRLDTSLTGGIHTIWVMDDDGFNTGSYGLTLLGSLPMPVTWLYFNGKQVGKDIRLTWATGSEQNTKEFIIERSFNGRQYVSIGSVMTIGSSNHTTNYGYTDVNVKTVEGSEIYYRLKQIDIDGKYEYSTVVSIPVQSSSLDLIVNAYPNPFSKKVTVQLINVTASGHVDKVELYSMDGRLLYQRRLTSTSNSNIVLDDLPDLSKGTYLLKTIIKDRSFINKIFR